MHQINSRQLVYHPRAIQFLANTPKSAGTFTTQPSSPLPLLCYTRPNPLPSCVPCVRSGPAHPPAPATLARVSAHLARSSLMVCPLKHGSPVSSISDTSEMTASQYGLKRPARRGHFDSASSVHLHHRAVTPLKTKHTSDE